MKSFLTSALTLLVFSIFAQSTQPKNTSKNKPAQNTTASTTTPKVKALCTTWYLSQTEVFSDIHKPTEQQKGDLLILLEGGQYRFIYNGVAEGGSWAIDKNGLWITLISLSGVTKQLKVLESTDKILKVDYKDVDDVHNVLYYSVSPLPVSTGK